MPARRTEPAAAQAHSHTPGMTPADILVALFKHKWIVLGCSLAGFVAAGLIAYINPVQYQSDAKLLVRYVVERSAVDAVQAQNADPADKPSDSVLNSEVEILSSWDLFEEVAEQVGAARLCPGIKDPSNIDAARQISAGLMVAVVPRTNVILVTFRHPNPEVAPLVLQDLLEAYFSRHLDIHRSKAAFDLVSQKTDMLRAELSKTEDDLKKKKAEANIISLAESAKDLNQELTDTQREVEAVTTALAEQKALVQALEAASPPDESAERLNPSGTASRLALPGGLDAAASASNPASQTSPASADDVEKYLGYLSEIHALRKRGMDLLSNYQPGSEPVRQNDAQIVELEGERRAMESQHPDLTRTEAFGNSGGTGGSDLVTERARLAALEARMASLQTRLRDAQARAGEFSKLAPDIEELERNKMLELADYTSSQSKLENATVDEALDPSKIPNISIVQKPSVSMKVEGERLKAAVGAAGGGVGAGVGLALALEMMFSRAVKRPFELEQKLGIPVLLSIPFTAGGRKRLRLPGPGGSGTGGGKALVNGVRKEGQAAVAPWEPAHFVRPYAEAIRDNLGLYFEVNNMTHRPKLLAVVGMSEGSGASTLAAGIAAALSEVGEGKILLVDMNLRDASVHPYFQGRPACSLTEALAAGGPPQSSAADNLYLATMETNGGGQGKLGLKRFQELIPYVNESDFDYVLFDMPPLSQTSPTLAMTSFMDKVFLVVEAEKNNADEVKRGFGQLMARKAEVSVIFNKVRSYAPRWIEGMM